MKDTSEKTTAVEMKAQVDYGITRIKSAAVFYAIITTLFWLSEGSLAGIGIFVVWLGIDAFTIGLKKHAYNKLLEKEANGK